VPRRIAHGAGVAARRRRRHHARRVLPDAETLDRSLCDARARTLALVDDLAGVQWIGPELAIVNPPLWEIGHVAWFQEYWVLRQGCGRPPLLPEADGVYDSAGVHHPERWVRVLPPLDRCRAYLAEVLLRSREAIAARPHDERLAYFAALALFHEDMHGEALLYTRQTLGYREPVLERPLAPPPAGGPCRGDAVVAGATFPLGAARERRFVFDNEKWAHDVDVPAFALARAPVTEVEYAAFVDDGGYRRRELWCPAGAAWREQAGAETPVYWRRDGGGWLQRRFDAWRPLRPHAPMLHVNWFEADAYCRWAGRRLPTEAEWERAACGAVAAAARKPRWPWGGHAPTDRAHLDGTSLDCADVGALAAGDTPDGVRQLAGNVWEWTASPFAPYPDFCADAYREYSEPWFHTRFVLRGGCFATRSRMVWNTLRNFFTPDRRDVFAGFRTVALDA
jgi:iron(II)-dependent oxidoreductase